MARQEPTTRALAHLVLGGVWLLLEGVAIGCVTLGRGDVSSGVSSVTRLVATDFPHATAPLRTGTERGEGKGALAIGDAREELAHFYEDFAQVAGEAKRAVALELTHLATHHAAAAAAAAHTAAESEGRGQPSLTQGEDSTRAASRMLGSTKQDTRGQILATTVHTATHGPRTRPVGPFLPRADSPAHSRSVCRARPLRPPSPYRQ